MSEIYNHKENNVITVTNNNVKYYTNLADQCSKNAANSVIKAAAYAKEAEEYKNACENLKETIDDETMQLVSLHSEKQDNPHNVTAAQAGAYSKTELDSLLATNMAKKNPNLVAGENIVITANEDGTQTIKSSNTVSLDYTLSQNKPSINNVTLTGNKSSHDLGLASLEDLPVNVSELQNDSGYITQHQDISGKQDVLSAGSGIAIENNTVSTVNRANTDLSNLSSAGKKVLDGQWVMKNAELLTSIKSGSTNVDLSEYLPSDTYNYEILLTGRICGADSTTPRNVAIANFDDNAWCWTGRSTTYNSGSVLVPIFTNSRVLNLNCSSSPSSFTLSAHAYRRIGTNS